jgi:rRNA-processing protein FCF1
MPGARSLRFLNSATILLADANIVIDFLKADRLGLEQICTQLDIFVPRIIIQDEIKQLSMEEATSIGLKIADIEFPQLTEASTGSIRISFYDRVCLILSRDNHWICISNDKKLHAECITRNISVIWGLELILHAVRQRVFSKDRAIICFAKIQSVNNRINQKIEDEFLFQLNEID